MYQLSMKGADPENPVTVAVKVSSVPQHIVSPALADIVTEGDGFTVTIIIAIEPPTL